MDQPSFGASHRTRKGGPKPKGRVDDGGRECTKCSSYQPWNQYDRAASGYFAHDSICKRCKADRLRNLREARLAELSPEEWSPPSSGCESTARYTEVMPLQYGIYVYRCWAADGSCVYVGRTRHVPRRLGGHALVAWWRDVDHVDVACMGTAEEAAVEEITQIRHWRPANNSDHNRTFARKSAKPAPTHCPHGHEYTEPNTIYNANGSKVCRECKNARTRAQPKKGIARGERQGSAKLTGAAVADIRRRHALGQSVSALARDYQVSRKSVDSVVRGKTWSHILASAKPTATS